MKKLKWIAVAIVALIVVALGVVWLNLNGIVRRTVETQTAASLDVPTTLGGANVSIFGGSLKLNDLNIGSPPDYKAPQMLSLGQAGVNVELSQLRQDPIHIKQVTIDKPKVVIEANGAKLNFQALMDRQSKTPADKGSSSEPIKVIIDQLDVRGAQIALRPGIAIPGLKEEYSLTIPDLSLKNVGRGEGEKNGAAIKEVVVELLAALSSKAAESDQLPKELRDVLHLNVDAVTARLGEEINKQIGNVTKDLGKNIPGDAGKSLEKGVSDLLGGKKKDEKKAK